MLLLQPLSCFFLIIAYLNLRCGNAKDKEEAMQGLDTGHGRHFNRVCQAVSRCSVKCIGLAVRWGDKDVV